MSSGSAMSTDSTRRPENGERRLPSASFDLYRWQVELIRDESIRRGISQSEVVRQALGVAFGRGTEPLEADRAAAAKRAKRSELAEARTLVRELAAIRTELYLLRALLGYSVDATINLEEPTNQTDSVIAIVSFDESLPCPSANDHEKESKLRARPLGYRAGP